MSYFSKNYDIIEEITFYDLTEEYYDFILDKYRFLL